jgi:hypothetical protein
MNEGASCNTYTCFAARFCHWGNSKGHDGTNQQADAINFYLDIISLCMLYENKHQNIKTAKLHKAKTIC